MCVCGAFSNSESLSAPWNRSYLRSLIREELEVPGSILGVGKGISVSEHAFHHVSCRDYMKTMRLSSDRDNMSTPVQGKSHPVQVKNPTVIQNGYFSQ